MASTLPPPLPVASKALPTPSALTNVKTNNVKRQSGIVLKPITTKKLIDILNPKRPPLPVVLPPVGISRTDKPANKSLLETSSSSVGEQPPEINDQGEAKSTHTKATYEVPWVEGDDDPNPFLFRESMENIADPEAGDEEEVEHKKEEPEETNPLMKGTILFRQNQTVLRRIKPFLAPAVKASLANEYRQIVVKAQNGLHINHLQKVSRKIHTEYITQRKTIYYLRRAIRARKIALEMIRKTREFEEACLQDYEWLTDFTKEAFESFLRENDEETRNAARKAEIALKEKLDKTLQCRQLNIQINQIKTDIINTNESLRECKVYMRFLDDIAREIMRKDEEEEIRAMHRELQVKEELIGYLKEGMSLRKAQQMIQDKAKELYDENVTGGGAGGGGRSSGSGGAPGDATQSRASFGGGSMEFIENLNKQVRQHLGIPEEPIHHTEDEKRKSQERRKSGVEEKDKRKSDDWEDNKYMRKSLDDGHRGSLDEGKRGSLVEDQKKLSLNNAGLMSAKSIVSGLVFRNRGRLNRVVQKDEEGQFDLAPLTTLRRSLRNSIPQASKEDADGYNETDLMKSLDLVPGNEASDRRELASLSFTRPSQLLQIFSDMEETNLSLLQHSQASEELLERVNQQILHTRRALNHRGRLLREDINHMQQNIDANEEKATALAMLVEMFTGGNYDVRQQQKLFKVLQHHVAKVYKTAVGSIDQHLNPIMMLTSIEKNFEDLMREIQAMPTDVVLQISSQLDKERREMERLEKMNRRKSIQEERKSRALDRAQAPIQRKKGRPLLARSHPPKVVVQLSQAELDRKAEEDEFNYFFGP